MSSTTATPIDMVRLAALIGRFEADHPGSCDTAGCVHLHEPVAAAEGGRERPLAA
jgi:hypothetical protein